IATIVALLKRLVEADRHLRSGGSWEPRDRFLGGEASGRVLGLVGLGYIARDVARRAQAGLDMEVIGFNRSGPNERYEAAGVRRCPDLRSLLAESDVVSVHVPYTPETKGLIGEAELAAMRPGAVLVNTARGGV